jgi:plastocyanin
MRARPLTTALAVISLAGAAFAPSVALGGAHAAGVHTVTLRHSTFSPATISIRRGESVRWVWAPGKVLHNVIGHSFQSRTQTHGSYTLRFTHRGSFSYTCTVHPGMNGRVIVH